MKLRNKYVIDTSSLLSLVRYYHPFDKDRILYKFIEERFIQSDFILLESVLMEIKNISKGIIIKAYPFLENQQQGSSQRIKAKKNLDILDSNMHERIKSSWVNKKQGKKFKQDKTEEEFEGEYAKYIKGADCQLILYAKENSQGNLFPGKFIVVTEETPRYNDGKLFKKIPLICKPERIECQTLPDMLQQLSFTVNYQKYPNSK